MKKTHIILIGAAGAAAALVLGVGLAAGEGFKLGSMASVSGIVAEAETTQETEAAPETVVSSEASYSAEAVIAGADSVENAVFQTETEPAEDVQSADVETQAVPVSTPANVADTVTYSTVTYEAVSESAAVSVVKASQDVFVNASAKKTENIVSSYKKPAKDSIVITEKKNKDANENIAVPAEPAEGIEDTEPDVMERLGCASSSEAVFDEDGNYIGNVFECSCGAYEISDIDGNVVYSKEDSDYELSHDEIMDLLKERAEARGEASDEVDSIEPELEEIFAEPDAPAENENIKDFFEEELEESENDFKSEDEDVDTPADDFESDDVEDGEEADYAEDGEGKVGCASVGYLLCDENEEVVGSVSICYVCETQDVFDNDWDNVYHADGYENFLSDEEAVEILK